MLSIRRELKERSVLGEYGAAAIQAAMCEQARIAVPSVATISRILVRYGAVDARGRQRRPAPPSGWYCLRWHKPKLSRQNMRSTNDENCPITRNCA